MSGEELVPFSFNMSFNHSESSVSHPAEVSWAWWMKQILTPLVVVIGIGGNSLSFAVMKTKSWRHKSYSHFLCALAVFDSLTLINRETILVHDVRIYAGESGLFAGFSNFACSSYNFYEHMCYLMSSWLIVCMAMERVVAVYFPLRKAFLCTPNGGLVIIMVLLITLTYTQVFRFFMVGTVEETCAARNDYLVMYTNLHVYLYQFIFIFILPVTIVLTCNVMVLCKIYRVMKPRSPDDRLSRSRRNVAKTHKTTIMLVIISFVYVITLLPSLIVSVVVHVAIATRYSGILELFFTISPLMDFFELFSDINYCSNFFIYILSGKMFRSELKKLFSMERNSTFTLSLHYKAKDGFTTSTHGFIRE